MLLDPFFLGGPEVHPGKSRICTSATMRVTAFLVIALFCLATLCVAGKSDDAALRLNAKSVAEARSGPGSSLRGARRAEDDHDHDGDGHADHDDDDHDDDHSSGSNSMGINLHVAAVFMAGVVTLVGNTAPRSY